MNLKTFIALIVAAAVAVIVAVIMTNKDSESWQTVEVGGLLFENLPVNDIEKITVKKGDDSLTLNKDNNVWVVANRFNYPASFQAISDLAIKLSELKPLRVVEASSNQLSRLSLLPYTEAENSGTLLEMTGKGDKKIVSLLLGKEFVRQAEAQRSPMMGGGEIPEGRYIIVENKPPVYLIAETLETVASTDPKPWLSKDFIKVEKLSSVSVQFMGEPAPDWEFTRESASDTFKLTNQQPTENVDSSKTRSLSSVFTYASFIDVLPADTDPNVTRLNNPTIAILKTLDGFTYTLNIGRLTSDETGRYLAVKVDANLPTARTPKEDEKAEDKARLDADFQKNLEHLQKKLAQEKQAESWIYIVSTWTVDNLLKNRVDWMKAEDPNAPQETAVQPQEQDETIPAMLERPADELEQPEGDDIQPEPANDENGMEEEPEPAEPTGNEDVIIIEDELPPPDLGEEQDEDFDEDPGELPDEGTTQA